MKLFFRYLGQKRWSIAVFALFCLIFFIFFLLFHLPTEAVIYPMALCFVLGVVFLLLRFSRFSHAYHTLLHYTELTAEQLPHLPVTDDVMASLYREIIEKLQDEVASLVTSNHLQHREMMEYYTLWAHQIKTPISAMKLVLQSQDDPTARTLNFELFRIEQYVEMVMNYLRSDDAQSDFVFCDCALDPIIRQSVKRFSSEFICRKIRLDYAPTTAHFTTDAKWFSFVLEQILSNALKYTPEGTISISVKDETLCIADSGIGIAAEDLPRVFDKGYTGYNGRRDMRASGIGLFLCRRICGKLGIKIGISSELGRGTCVTLSLPRQKPILE